ncbi:hypothetical protein GCM10010387_46250 [Streptomyces inusitatus]|uniref:Aminoacyl-transfer RNA synthetases class-II family profile domain-containing protein n=1 Tax=Streptomyces inusitatus TaxID=68221 RepID=A0A918V014_9ACTN|nr:hypothetical protein [Streptomyces inusitatus]GGZ46546.1 hypothetical protein GCM10010387_46250 [Streptomyces inusitatus]
MSTVDERTVTPGTVTGVDGEFDTDGAVRILGPDQTELLKELDQIFAGWGVAAGAREICPPPVFPVSDLAKFDVYKNFPHLTFVAGPLNTDHAADILTGGARVEPAVMNDARFGLPHATCYGAYLYYEGRRLEADTLVTLVNRCFRNETRYSGLRRLLSFQMREVVALGGFEHTQRLLEEFSGRIEKFSDALGLGLEKEAATDPFFESGGARALLQKLSPVKYEFHRGGLAIASVNTHRNFFGERCGITLAGEDEQGHAFTSCVAFGLERWLAVLDEVYEGDTRGALAAVRTAAQQVS